MHETRATEPFDSLAARSGHKKTGVLRGFFMAEKGRFELPKPFGLLAFQASALDHYATSPVTVDVSGCAKG